MFLRRTFAKRAFFQWGFYFYSRFQGFGFVFPLRGFVFVFPLWGCVFVTPLRGCVFIIPLWGCVSVTPLQGCVFVIPLWGMCFCYPLAGVCFCYPLAGMSFCFHLVRTLFPRSLSGFWFFRAFLGLPRLTGGGMHHPPSQCPWTSCEGGIHELVPAIRRSQGDLVINNKMSKCGSRGGGWCRWESTVARCGRYGRWNARQERQRRVMKEKRRK